MNDLSLFGDEEPPADHRVTPPSNELAAWLVKDIRQALEDRGQVSMPDRQRAIEEIVGRPVDSLQSLTRAEGLKVLQSLRPQASDAKQQSSWENRVEDTWIDRL